MIRKYGDSVAGELRQSFYDCSRAYSQAGPDSRLRERLSEALSQIDTWRLNARRRPLAEVLWQIYRDTAFISFVQALPNGPQRRANLLKLHERAIQFENFVAAPQTTSHARFVEFIEKLLETGRDWAPAEPDNITEDAVQIMSIHKSKGLEFPVVFGAELNTRFNKKDSYGDCLIDDDCGIGLQITESNVKLPAIAHEVIAEKKLDAMLAEEMRILYVAITRAREKLVLTASRSQKDCSDILAACSTLPDEPVRDWQLKSAKCHFDWILYALANHKKLNDLFKTAPKANTIDDNLFSTQLLDRNVLDEISAEILKKKHSKLTPRTPKISKSGKLLLAKLKNSLDWQYPFADLIKLSAKTSVSELTHRDDEFAKADFTDAFQRKPKVVSADNTDAKLIGTATHLVIQNLALDSDITFTSIRATAEKLVSRDKISPQVASQIDFDSILKFFQADLGKLLLEHEDNTLQEWPFTFALDAAQLGAESPGETVIVQGIIDMIVKTPAGLVIIDFKTDDVAAESACRRAQRYLDQLNLYAAAASAILKEKIAGSWLYFLKPAAAVNTQI
jgi:ATP-dependent helicase/nuclease subunit A